MDSPGSPPSRSLIYTAASLWESTCFWDQEVKSLGTTGNWPPAVWEVTDKLRENTAGFGCWLEGHGRLRKGGEKRGVGMGKVWVKELEEMAPEFRMRAD